MSGTVVNNISPYSSDYPLSAFLNGIKKQISKSNNVINNIIVNLVNDGIISDNINGSLHKKVKYVCNLSPKQIRDIESGVVKLTVENSKTYSQFKDGSHYGTKIDISKEVITEGFKPAQLTNALQFHALQAQLQNITNQINIIGCDLKGALQGQQNDRIAQYYSGLFLFMEAQSLTDLDMKKLLFVQAQTSLSDSIFKLTLEMQECISYLENGEYEQGFLNAKTKVAIEERMNKIHQCFEFIHQSYILKSAIYCECGEVLAMTKTLEEYGSFIENNISNNIKLLKGFDINDDGTSTGYWNSRKVMLEEKKNVAYQLEISNDEIYIELKESQDESK